MSQQTPRTIAALIRHADYQQRPDTPSAHQPYALTNAGEEQAAHAATVVSALADDEQWTIDAVIDSSHMLRAWQTARIMASQLDGVEQVESFEALAERSVGAVANLTMAEIAALVADDPRYANLPDNWKSDSEFRLPFQGAESLLQAGTRVADHLRKRMQELADTVTHDTLKLFIAHGASIRHAALELGVLSRDQVAALSMFHAQPIYLEYIDGSWIHNGGEWKVRRTGDTGLD